MKAFVAGTLAALSVSLLLAEQKPPETQRTQPKNVPASWALQVSEQKAKMEEQESRIKKLQTEVAELRMAQLQRKANLLTIKAELAAFDCTSEQNRAFAMAHGTTSSRLEAQLAEGSYMGAAAMTCTLKLKGIVKEMVEPSVPTSLRQQ
jgi:TolA-binding protein